MRYKTFLLTFLSAPLFASDYGTVGLIDTPTARMSSDGVLTATVSTQGRTNSYALTYQITPWLEGTFRYTGYNNFHYYDRNYEAKIRLWSEQDYIPQVAVGIRDLVGTGIFGSEYLVASKAFGNFDVSFGAGWGRLAGDGVISNPMKMLSSSFAVREKDTAGFGTTGVFQPGLFFSGDKIGFFGGISYELDSLPLSLMLEYNPDKYLFETRQTGIAPDSAWSAGVTWQAKPGVNLSLTRQQNDEWGISLVAWLDTKSPSRRRAKPLYKSSLITPAAELPPMLNQDSWYDRLLYDVERSGLILVEASIDKKTEVANVVMGNRIYPMWNDALDQMIVLADLHIPKEVKLFRIVVEEEGHQVHTVHIERPSRNPSRFSQNYKRKAIITKPETVDIPQHKTNFVQKKVFIDASLSTKFQFFDPDDPARYQIYGKIGVSIALPRNWAVRGNYGVDLDNTFDEITRDSNSELPHVRSDVAKYLSKGASGIDSLFLEKRGSLSSEFHYRLFGGVLEEMYSGFGGELLYQPYKSRLAFGVSANRVQQRDYDGSFKHLDYRVNTAFASAYWATPFNNFDVAIHAGQYLAGDTGASFEVRRTFANGWMIGMWGTLTDVSYKEFGEGSFDKGMFLRVPLDGLLRRNVRASYSTRIRPILRDGGARLEDFSGNIWWDLRGVRYDSLNEYSRRAAP